MNHQEIIELLPWYANATLEGEERRTVEAHLAECRECAREVESLAAMRRAVVALANQAPEPSPHLLNRSLAEIEDYELSRAQAAKPAQRGQRFQAFRESWWPKTPLFARTALAAQLALLLMLGTVAVYQYNHPQVIYKTTAGPSLPNAGLKISVMFNAGASEREIRKTLEEIHGQIVGGPSAQELFTIQTDVPPDKPQELEALLQKLRQNQRVIRLAEKTE